MEQFWLQEDLDRRQQVAFCPLRPEEASLLALNARWLQRELTLRQKAAGEKSLPGRLFHRCTSGPGRSGASLPEVGGGLCCAVARGGLEANEALSAFTTAAGDD